MGHWADTIPYKMQKYTGAKFHYATPIFALDEQEVRPQNLEQAHGVLLNFYTCF